MLLDDARVLIRSAAAPAVIAAFRDTTAFDTRLFGIAAISGVLVWTAGQVAALSRRREPEPGTRPHPNP